MTFTGIQNDGLPTFGYRWIWWIKQRIKKTKRQCLLNSLWLYEQTPKSSASSRTRKQRQNIVIQKIGRGRVIEIICDPEPWPDQYRGAVFRGNMSWILLPLTGDTGSIARVYTICPDHRSDGKHSRQTGMTFLVCFVALKGRNPYRSHPWRKRLLVLSTV